VLRYRIETFIRKRAKGRVPFGVCLIFYVLPMVVVGGHGATSEMERLYKLLG
jgi:hypothetical protein